MLSNELPMVFKIVLCSILMFILGKERQKTKRFIGPRTVILMGCATTLLSVTAIEFNNFFILGGIITGVGFLGGGVITQEKGKVSGLTTAALVWMAATIGIFVGLGLYVTSIFTTIFSFCILRSKDLIKGKDVLRIFRN